MMTVSTEFEVKLEVEPATLRRLNRLRLIKTLKQSPKQASQTTVYFDTANHRLRKKGLTLRVRRAGGRHVQTIKASGNSASIERNEWENEISGPAPDFAIIKGTPVEDLLTKKIRRKLKPAFETRIRRTTYPLLNKETAIELTIDRGKIDNGHSSTPVCELELELKRGDKSRLFEIARTIERAFAAQVSLKSKAERGYELIDGCGGAPVKAVPVQLPPSCNARESFKVIGFSCLKQITDNVPAILKVDPEGVHQMRIGVRRLRAAMSLFKDVLQDDQTARIKAELKWFTAELGPAREFEVLTERAIAPFKERHSRLTDGVASFSKAVTRKHDAALARAKEAVASSRFRSLVFEVTAWLEVGAWTNPADDLVRNRGEVAIKKFAAEQLRRRSRKVRKRGRRLAELNARKRHKLRIRVKKLRYAAEFFSGLFEAKKAIRRQKKFKSALKRLQGGLGDLNDIAVDKNLIAGVDPPRHGFAAGLLTGREEAREKKAMLAAVEGHKDLLKVKSFWR
jgi:triphosphatase